MKKIVILMLLFGLITLGSCKDKGNSFNNQDYVNDNQSSKKIDIDMTKMSSTIVYSQVYDMMCNPKKYEGKIVKVGGLFNVFYSGETKLYYPTVIIADATACCSQGIEFVLNGNPTYPNGYPKKDEEIFVVGTFETYRENNNLYCHLVDAKLV